MRRIRKEEAKTKRAFFGGCCSKEDVSSAEKNTECFPVMFTERREAGTCVYSACGPTAEGCLVRAGTGSTNFLGFLGCTWAIVRRKEKAAQRLEGGLSDGCKLSCQGSVHHSCGRKQRRAENM